MHGSYDPAYMDILSKEVTYELTESGRIDTPFDPEILSAS
jgi:hypothetical protein